MRKPKIGNEEVSYQAVSCTKLLVKMKPRSPSMPSASAYVTSTESASRSLFSGLTKTTCKTTPSRNMAGIVTTRLRNGSMRKWRSRAKLR